MFFRDLWHETFLWCFIKLIKLYRFNRANQTEICSYYASLSAKYGKKVLISKDTYIEDNVEIGDYSYVNTNSYIENCVIGKFCSISSGVYISPWEHNLSLKTTHPIGYDEETKNRIRKKVEIGNDVLISLNCIILEGVKIGNGAVIGAGSVVTKDVLPYEIVAGVPAQHLRFRFEKDIRENIDGLKWWDWDINKINTNLAYLQNKVNYIKEHREKEYFI